MAGNFIPADQAKFDPDPAPPGASLTTPGLPPAITGTVHPANSIFDPPPSLTDRVYNSVVGQKQYDFPLLGPEMMLRSGMTGEMTPEQKAAHEVALGMMWARDDDQRRHLISGHYPNARYSSDAYDNPVVQIGPDRYYLNHKGITSQDINEVMAPLAVQSLTGMAGANAGKAVLGAAGRIAGAGLGMGAGSVVQDIAGNRMGTGQKIDPTAALTSAAGGAAAETLLPPAIRAFGTLFRQPGVYDAAAGKLTADGEALLRKMGIDPAGVAPDTLQRMSEMARNTTKPEAAVRQAEAQGLPVPLTLTTGQATRNSKLYALDSEAKKGLLGETPQTIAQATQDTQQAALKGNIPAIQQELTGGATPAESSTAAVKPVQAKLLAMRDAMGKQVDTAYDAARAGEDAWFPRKAVTDMSTGMRFGINSAGYDLTSMPVAQKLMQRVEDMTSPYADSSVSIRGLEDWRRQAVKGADTTTIPAEQSAIRDMIRHYDGQLEGSLKGALLSGDADAIARWSSARTLRARMGQIFQDNDIVNELTSKMSGGTRQLAVTPDDAANYIFGRADLGAKTGLSRDVAKLKTVLGEDSPEWGQLREAAFLHMFRRQPADKALNATMFANELDRALQNAPDTMKTLFTPQELSLFQAFKRTITNVNTLPEITANANPSGTNMAMAISNAFGPVGKMAKAYADHFLEPVYGAQATAAARSRAAGDLPQRQMLVPSGLPGGVAGNATGAAGASMWDVLKRNLPWASSPGQNDRAAAKN